MNCVGGGKAFSRQAFWVLGWAYSSSVFWVRGELWQMEEWAILQTAGQGQRPAIRRAWHCQFSSGDVSALISVRLWAPLLVVNDDKYLRGPRDSRVVSSWYTGLAATIATSEPQIKKKQRFPCKLKPCEGVTQFLSGFVCEIKRRGKKLFYEAVFLMSATALVPGIG